MTFESHNPARINPRHQDLHCKKSYVQMMLLGVELEEQGRLCLLAPRVVVEYARKKAALGEMVLVGPPCMDPPIYRFNQSSASLKAATEQPGTWLRRGRSRGQTLS